MEQFDDFSGFGVKRIYTLGQNWTENKINAPVLITGKGSDLTTDKTKKGRAKRKVITQSMVLALIDIAKAKGNEPMLKQLWNTYHCQEQLFSFEGRLYGKYCKNRICTLCNSIRKAELINKYLPVIEHWEDPQFLTLTIKSIRAISLKKFMAGMVKAFRQIKDTQKKRNIRGKGIRLIGIKSLECNFNPVRRTYNPHFHLILPDKETAELLIAEWLKKWTPKWTNRRAQFYAPVYDKEKALIEIIKYGSKIFTEPDLDKKSKLKVSPQIYAAALYNILKAMKGHRLFDRVGFNLPKMDEQNEGSHTITSDYKKWLFEPCLLDWYNEQDNELLTDYQPPIELLMLLGNNIDTQLE